MATQPHQPYVDWLQQFIEGTVYQDTVIQPYTGNNFIEHVRYGKWTGSAYSALHFSPSFLNYTELEKTQDTQDDFDEISKTHDKAYETAQKALVAALKKGQVCTYTIL